MANTTSESDLLKIELSAITADSRGWSGRRATSLLLAVEARFAAMDRREGTEIGSALTHAWELWSNPAPVLAADNAWAYTVWAVRSALGGERFAAQTRTSTEALRRVGHNDVTAADFVDEGEEQMTKVASAEPARVDEVPVFTLAALRSAVDEFVSAGHDRGTATVAVEALVNRAAESTSPSAAADRAGRETAIPEALGVDVVTYRRVARVILGTKRGAPGAIAVELAQAADPGAGGEPEHDVVSEPIGSTQKDTMTFNQTAETALNALALRANHLETLRSAYAPAFIIATKLDLISRGARDALDAMVETDDDEGPSHGDRHLASIRRTHSRLEPRL